MGHAHGEGLEVVQLVGQTNSVTVEEDEVARLLADLVHLKHTLLEHGLLQLREEVFAETHGPSPRTALVLPVYSFTRPLILDTLPSTILPSLFFFSTEIFPLEKMEGMVSPPKPRPSAFTVGMLAVEAMVVMRSPREDRFLPLPLVT